MRTVHDYCLVRVNNRITRLSEAHVTCIRGRYYDIAIDIVRDIDKSLRAHVFVNNHISLYACARTLSNTGTLFRSDPLFAHAYKY